MTIDDELDFENIISNDSKICELGLYRLDFNKVKFDYKYFHYIQNNKYDYAENIYNMEQIKKIQKINEFERGLHNITNEILEFKRKNGAISYFNYQFEKIKNLFFNWWSGYGIEKNKIFKNTGILFVISYILIWAFFDFWIRKVYRVDAIKKPYNDYISDSHIKKTCLFDIKRLLYSFYYTCLIFFGLQLTISNLKFKRLSFIFIIIIYLIGLFCTAYLIAFFLDKF